MEELLLGTKNVCQIGYVVRDIRESSEKFAKLLGADIPDVISTETLDKTDWEYMGQPMDVNAKIIAFNAGSVDIELIQPVSGTSTWQDFLDENGEGIHHIAFSIKDTQNKIARLEKIGSHLIQKGELPDGRYTYMDTYKDYKVIIELREHDSQE